MWDRSSHITYSILIRNITIMMENIYEAVVVDEELGMDETSEKTASTTVPNCPPKQPVLTTTSFIRIHSQFHSQFYVHVINWS